MDGARAAEHMAQAQRGGLVGTPRTFRDRPGTVEAMQLDGENWALVAEWCGGDVIHVQVFESIDEDHKIVKFPRGVTPAIRYEARVTDWIVKKPDGSFYAQDDAGFMRDFEEA